MYGSPDDETDYTDMRNSPRPQANGAQHPGEFQQLPGQPDFDGQRPNPEFLEQDPTPAMDDRSLSKNCRLPFVRKVFGILTIQLLATTGVIALAMEWEAFREYQLSSASLWTLIVGVIISLTCIYALVCYRKLARTVPTNYIILAVFTICEAYTVSFSCVAAEPKDVLVAAGITATMVVGLTLYAIFTKTDFTSFIAFGVSMGITLIVCMMMECFTTCKWLTLLISAVCAVILCIYIIIDIQLIFNKGRHGYSIDDYIVAALNIYIDIIQLFLQILNLVSNS